MFTLGTGCRGEIMQGLCMGRFQDFHPQRRVFGTQIDDGNNNEMKTSVEQMRLCSCFGESENVFVNCECRFYWGLSLEQRLTRSAAPKMLAARDRVDG